MLEIDGMIDTPWKALRVYVYIYIYIYMARVTDAIGACREKRVEKS